MGNGEVDRHPQNAPNLKFFPDPAGGAYSAHPDPPSWWEWGSLPLPQEAIPRSPPFGLCTQHTHILLHGGRRLYAHRGRARFIHAGGPVKAESEMTSPICHVTGAQLPVSLCRRTLYACAAAFPEALMTSRSARQCVVSGQRRNIRNHASK